jgi:hypothetical protein
MTDYGPETPGYIGVDQYGHPVHETPAHCNDPDCDQALLDAGDPEPYRPPTFGPDGRHFSDEYIAYMGGPVVAQDAPVDPCGGRWANCGCGAHAHGRADDNR